MITAILKDKALPPGMDFDKLRLQGLARLQQLTSNNWTDFNEHDPGVTILEQLCYGITDISYRANYPIEDLLFEANDAEGGRGQCFFSPAEILTIAPVTLQDYRKALLYDYPELVKNAWVTVLGNDLHIAVELHDSAKLLTQTEATLSKSLNLNKYRSFGEGLIKITPLQQVRVGIAADIYINKDIDAEQTIAELLNAISQYIAPTVKLYSVNELLQNEDINEIIQGPAPKNGVIKDDDLLDKPNGITCQLLIKIIMAVVGVRSVENIAIVTDDGASPGQDFVLAKNVTGSLDMERSLDNIKIFVNNSRYNVNKQEVLSLCDGQYLLAGTNSNQNNDQCLIPPKGKNRNISNYYSIQEAFPAIYGIGKNGLPATATELRRAQAKQLKAYLLGFEQIIANSLSQLSNAWHLFQVSPKTQAIDGSNNYTQPLYNVPGVEQVIKDYVKNYDLEQQPQDWDRFRKSGHNSYEAKLQRYGTALDDPKRKGLFLDHLLARFGQDAQNYEAPAKAVVDIHSQNNIVKSNTLYYYNKISAERASAGCDMDKTLRSGLKIQLCILLGIEVSTSQNAFLILENELIDNSSADAILRPTPSILSFAINTGTNEYTAEFKEFLTRQIHLLTPAHLQPSTYWLEPSHFTKVQMLCK